jgi:hypothetical protein
MLILVRFRHIQQKFSPAAQLFLYFQTKSFVYDAELLQFSAKEILPEALKFKIKILRRKETICT